MFGFPQDFTGSTRGGTGKFIRIKGLFFWGEYLFDTGPAFIQRGRFELQLEFADLDLMIGFFIGNPKLIESYAIRMLLPQDYLS